MLRNTKCVRLVVVCEQTLDIFSSASLIEHEHQRLNDNMTERDILLYGRFRAKTRFTSRIYFRFSPPARQQWEQYYNGIQT